MKKILFLNMLARLLRIMEETGPADAYNLGREDCGRAFSIKKEIRTIIENNGYEINRKSGRVIKSKSTNIT